jgi:hypothetical protein
MCCHQGYHYKLYARLFDCNQMGSVISYVSPRIRACQGVRDAKDFNQDSANSCSNLLVLTGILYNIYSCICSPIYVLLTEVDGLSWLCKKCLGNSLSANPQCSLTTARTCILTTPICLECYISMPTVVSWVLTCFLACSNFGGVSACLVGSGNSDLKKWNFASAACVRRPKLFD